jgi:hypothetical protein
VSYLATLSIAKINTAWLIDECSIGGMIVSEETESFKEKPVAVTICPPQI